MFIMKYEIWISPFGANNQNKPQVHEKQWLSIYWFHTNTFSVKNYVAIHIGFGIWATKTEIPLYKQPKIEESFNLLDQESNM
jgi:hypothetical protein